MKSTLSMLGLAILANTTAAQVAYDGDAPGARLGEHFDVIPDIDGDGINDLIAGFPEDDTRGTDAGRVLLISGATGATLRQHLGENAGDRFGEKVSRAGQLDGDGIGDYMVSAPAWGNAKGAVYAYSGSAGGSLFVMRGTSSGDALGTSIDRAGDIDGDGTGDVIVGAPGVDLPITFGTDVGTVYVVSGATGLPLSAIEPVALDQGLGFGEFVSYIGDLDGDGKDDIFASGANIDNPGQYPPGHFAIFSSADSSMIFARSGSDDGHGVADHVGNGICALGDITGDGVTEYAYGVLRGADLAFPGEFEGHSVVVLNGDDHSVVAFYDYDISAAIDHILDPVPVGDVNGDGLPDLAYWSPNFEFVRVVSPFHSAEIATFQAPVSGLEFGRTIRGIEDMTGDGLPDIAVGVPGFDGPAGSASGQILVYSAANCTAPTNYCSASPNSSGLPAWIYATGTSNVAQNDLTLNVYGCPANKPGMFFYGPNQVSSPAGDGVLCVGAGGLGHFRVKPPITTDEFGMGSKLFDLTALPASAGGGQVLAGSTWNFQFWFRDPQGGPAGFNFSDGLEVSFCP